MSLSIGKHELKLSVLGAAALIGAAGATVAVVWGVVRIGGSAIVANAAAGEVASPDSRGPDLEIARARIDGRSLFFVPSAPPPPPPPPPPVVQDDRPPPAPPPPPPPPSRYGGPAIVALINDRVWLAGGDMLGPGESASGVRVIAVDAPWSARLEWSGVEFDVELFARDAVVYPDGVLRGREPASEGAQAMELPSGAVEPGESDERQQAEEQREQAEEAEHAEQPERAVRRDDDADAEGTSR